jgi:hypothetical protein
MAARETNAYTQFLKLRWPPDGKPVCTRCGSERVYTLGTRATFKCGCCKKHFSATSGTIFAGHKLTFEQLLAFLGSKDLNALRISREMGIEYKPAWVMCAKLREMYANGRAVGDQVRARARGYFQHGSVPPTCCSRCERGGVPLALAMFELDRQVGGSFCGDCHAALSELQDEFRANYDELRAVMKFKEELHDHTQKHGRPAAVSR